MTKNATARKTAVQEKPVMAIVKPSNGKKTIVEKLKESAEEIEAQEVTTALETIQEQKPTEKAPTLDELKSRAMILFVLQEKHTDLMEKRAKLQRFSIKHDDKNASIEIIDANGMNFRSGSPMAISSFIDFCLREFDDKIKEVEEKLTKKFNLSA